MFGESLKDHMTEEKYEAWLNKVRNNKKWKAKSILWKAPYKKSY